MDFLIVRADGEVDWAPWSPRRFGHAVFGALFLRKLVKPLGRDDKNGKLVSALRR